MRQKKGAIVKQEKSGEIQKLKNRIKRLEKDKKELISKLNTAERVLEQNIKFLKGTTEDTSLEDLLDAAKENKSYKEMEDEKCPKCSKNTLKNIKTRFGVIRTCSCGFADKRLEDGLN